MSPVFSPLSLFPFPDYFFSITGEKAALCPGKPRCTQAAVPRTSAYP